MRVLLFTQYYRPEITAAAMRTEAFVDGLIARGHEVDVICEVPSHPQGVIDPAFRGPDGLSKRGGRCKGAPGLGLRAAEQGGREPHRRLRERRGGRRRGGVRGRVRTWCSPPRRPFRVGSAAPPTSHGALAYPGSSERAALWPDIAVVLGRCRRTGRLELAAGSSAGADPERLADHGGDGAVRRTSGERR